MAMEMKIAVSTALLAAALFVILSGKPCGAGIA
jgi:hypothetical protein